MQAGNSMIPDPREFYTSKNDRLQDLQHWWQSMTPGLITIVAGDFNESHAELFGGKAIAWLENDKNMTDAINEFDGNTYSWQWPLPLGFKLQANFDHIFYFKSELICKTAAVLTEGASDHYPVLAEFVVKNKFDQ